MGAVRSFDTKLVDPPLEPGSCVVVVPTVRARHTRAFFDAWHEQFTTVQALIVIEDNPEPTFALGTHGVEAHHLSWADVERELGEFAWIIPRRSDCVRSFAYLKALELGARWIVTLDDDCHPIGPGFFESHAERLNDAGTTSAWESTLECVVPRGVPFESLKRSARVALSHGTWDVTDFDAMGQLVHGREERLLRTSASAIPRDFCVPQGSYFPMCGMNLAWRAELTPAMYFLLMGHGHPFDRFGDIWCGILVKRILDHLGWAVVSGLPQVAHRRASNVWANLVKEAPAIVYNERFWQVVDSTLLTADSPAGAYRELAASLQQQLGEDSQMGDYWHRLAAAMGLWVDLVEARSGVAQVEPSTPLAS
jgi:hypothetical protein